MLLGKNKSFEVEKGKECRIAKLCRKGKGKEAGKDGNLEYSLETKCRWKLPVNSSEWPLRVEHTVLGHHLIKVRWTRRGSE